MNNVSETEQALWKSLISTIKIKDKITYIIKTQNSTLKCVIDCQEKIKKLEKKNG